MRKSFDSFEWDMIHHVARDDVVQSTTYRAKVMGGWIVRSVLRDVSLKNTCESSMFIKDEDHQWKIANE